MLAGEEAEHSVPTLAGAHKSRTRAKFRCCNKTRLPRGMAAEFYGRF
jgi:hypothetical protein